MAITLCCDVPVPTFTALYQSLMKGISGDIPELTIPKLPGLRSPIFDGFSHPGLELSNLVQELQQFQLSLTLFNVFKPLADFLGGALEDLLPKIPGTDLTLLDIIAMDSSRIYAAVQAAIDDGFKFLMLPNPIFPDLSIPALETVATVKAIIRSYPAMVVTKIKELVGLVTDALELPGLPSIPELPTRDAIVKAALEAFPEVEQIIDLLSDDFSVSDLFSAFALPGFPPLILPKPLIPGMSAFSLEIEEAMSIFQADALGALVQPIVDFCEDTLGALGFEFPKICITF